MNSIICRAIGNHNLLSIYYDGIARVIEPYVHGLSLDDNEVVRVFQIFGGSKSGKLGWKLMNVSKMSNIRVLDENFAQRSDYVRNDKGMRLIHCAF